MKETLNLRVQSISHLNDIEIELYHVAVYGQRDDDLPLREALFATKTEVDNLLHRLNHSLLIQAGVFDAGVGISLDINISREEQDALWS